MKFCKVGIFLALLAAVCLPAMSQDSMIVNIPFGFSAAGKSLPAGRYVVAPVYSGNQAGWSVSSYQGGAVMITQAIESRQKAHRASLIFWHSGDTYSLVQIWRGGESGRELLVKPKVKTTMLSQGGKYVEIAGE
jgi:hypothetical protein